MCGILGIIDAREPSVTDARFLEALNTMEHRGPDGFGIFRNNRIAFGHRRLSIIDLSEHASQPFRTDDDKVVIVFNGEIYNYKEISKGLTLKTTSDTEVLLQGYIKHGIDFFKQIRGIYAFVIYDSRDGEKCIVYRDPGGVKPLYYFSSNHQYIFASEIKAILPLLEKQPEINDEVIKKYIHLGYCPEPETAFEGLFAAKPGELLVINSYHQTLSFTRTQLHAYDFKRVNSHNFDENKQETVRLLTKATKRNLVADVDVNIALSGGIDSSLIYAYANKENPNPVKGITISFDEKEYDESEVAKAYADYLHAPHIIKTVHTSNKLDLLNKLLLHFDQPYADSSFIPFYFLCNKAAEDSKVLIGGDSGDEIHNGYSGHRLLPLLVKIKSNALYKAITIMALSIASLFGDANRKRGYKKIRGLLQTKHLEQLLFYWESWFPPDTAMYPENPFTYDPTLLFNTSSEGYENDALGYISQEYFYGRMLGDYLRKSDMMSMLNSLEFRVPMLDEDLVAFAFTIPYHQKSDLKTQKKMLREMHSQTFPAEFSKLKKKGFTIPLDTWLGMENLNQMKAIIQDSQLVKRYIRVTYIDKLFSALGKDDHYISRASAYQRILILYSLALWGKQLKTI